MISNRLKEFFEVKLVLDNKAEAGFDIVNSKVKLNVPDGIAFIPTENSENETIDIGTLAGGATKEVSWIIRGDSKGEYDISAEFTGTLMPFEEELKAIFKPESSFRVYGSDALHMYIECPDYVYANEPAKVTISFKNVADFDVNKVNFDLGFESGGEPAVVKADILKPGEDVFFEGTITFPQNKPLRIEDVINLSDDENAIDYTVKYIKTPLEFEISDMVYNPYIYNGRSFTISAEVYNQKDSIIENLKASIKFNYSDAVEIIATNLSEDYEISQSNLKSGKRAYFVWNIIVKEDIDLKNLIYTVELKADGYNDVTLSKNIDYEFSISLHHFTDLKKLRIKNGIIIISVV